jgi:hypothetical protein
MVHLNGKMKFGELLTLYPQLKPIFRKYGIPVSG